MVATPIPMPTGFMTVDQIPEFTNQAAPKKKRSYNDLKIIDLPPKRRLFQQPFKLPYETPHDLRLRVLGTLIWIGPELYYVRDIESVSNREQWLIIEDEKQRRYRVEYYSTPQIDLRTPDPQYIIVEERPAFWFRRPSRQQQQGISYSNSAVKFVGQDGIAQFGSQTELIRAMKEADTLPWKADYRELMCTLRAFRALRLSPDVAVFRDEDRQAFLEYRGRTLGQIIGNTVQVSHEDDKPWIRADIEQVGCELRSH